MKRRSRIFIGFCALLGLAAGSALGADAKLKVLILSGANNHDWKTTTPAIKATLEERLGLPVDIVAVERRRQLTPFQRIAKSGAVRLEADP
jgi:ABC-type phosphate/phosphonate transport system substrate-binding protein